MEKRIFINNKTIYYYNLLLKKHKVEDHLIVLIVICDFVTSVSFIENRLTRFSLGF